MQEILTLHRVDITRMLQGLVRGGFLVPTGLGRGTRYQLAGPDPSTTSGLIQGTTGISHGNSVNVEISTEEPVGSPEGFPGNGGNSTGSGGSSTGNGGSSTGTGGGDSTGKAGSSTGTDARVPPHPEEMPQIDSWPSIVEKVRGSRRADPTQVRLAISTLCQGRFLTIKELADLLNRNEGHLRDSYVRDMLRTGHLVPRYPDHPHHPHQAYRAEGRGAGTGEDA